MQKILIVNGHQPHPSSAGALNAAFVKRSVDQLTTAGRDVRVVASAQEFDNETEIDHHLWADAIIYQFPIFSMGPPWSFKRYLDEVFTAGMDGRLSSGDGRSRKDPTRQYGSGGCMNDTRYMLSVTLNAPKTTFENPDQTFFAGRSIDDLLWPIHQNFRFFGMRRLPSFAAYDVTKNPVIEGDFSRHHTHLSDVFDIVAK